MNRLVNHRWFTLTALLLVCACGIILFFSPSVGGRIILIALLPVLVGAVAGRGKIRRTGIFVLLVVFLITAAIGIWTAYDRPAAWEKFWIIIGAAALFSALVSQPRANLGIVAGLVGFLGVIIAITYLLTNDWNSQASDLEVINRAGTWIAAVMPIGLRISLPPNITGGILAMIMSIPIALGVESWRKRNPFEFSISVIMGLIILLGLILTSSRGAWLALLTGLFIWMLWRSSHYLAAKLGRSQPLIFIAFLLVISIPVMITAATGTGGIISLAERLPGLSSGMSRLELVENTSKLIQDFPITGGGLRSFAGLYSQYIMVTPFFLFAYSHNFYLDLILELGWFGALAVITLFLTSALTLIRQMGSKRESSLVTLLSEAVMVGFIVVLLHGFVDDALFGDLGSPLLLLLPGLAILLSKVSMQDPDQTSQREASELPPVNFRSLFIPGSLILVFLTTLLVFRDSLVSNLYANLGAVMMARSDLKNWPTNKWNDDSFIRDQESAKEDFLQSLANDQTQRTAWHRLGLIAMQNRDYVQAQVNLERAYEIDPDHRGIRKSLGYTYVWLGKFEQAATLLNGINEAKTEMENYSWWWRERDRPDFSRHADEMAVILSLDGDIKQEGDN
jgi:O-antigen ligase